MSPKQPMGFVHSNETKPELSDDMSVEKQVDLNLQIKLYLKFKNMCHYDNAKKDEAKVCFILGHTFRQLMQYDDAIEYYQEGLIINEDLKNKGMQKNRFENVEEASIYEWCGYCCDNIDGRREEALKFYEKAKEIAKQLQKKFQEYRVTEAIGKIFANNRNHEKAKEYYDEALKIALELGDKHCEGKSYLNLASAYYDDGDYEMARKWYEDTLDIAGKEPMDRSLYNKAVQGLGLKLAKVSHRKNTEKEIQSIQESQSFASKEIKTGSYN